jgi:hypothetical protein
MRLTDDKIHPRYSSTQDPQLQAAPEGTNRSLASHGHLF